MKSGAGAALEQSVEALMRPVTAGLLGLALWLALARPPAAPGRAAPPGPSVLGPARLGALAGPSEQGRLWAGVALLRIGEPAVPALAARLKAADAGARRGAAEALALFGPRARAAVPALTAVRNEDPDPEVRAAAAA